MRPFRPGLYIRSTRNGVPTRRDSTTPLILITLRLFRVLITRDFFVRRSNSRRVVPRDGDLSREQKSGIARH